MDISINFLKEMALAVYNKVNPLIGTTKAAKLIQEGAGGDISMYIDIEAENVIVDLIEKNDVDLMLISEEVGEKYIGDKEKAIKNQQKIIVDPVDGSTNSIRGIPFCCCSIAYAKGNGLDDIEKAVIINLTTKDIYWAEKGKGAYINDKKIGVSTRGILDHVIFEIDFDLENVSEELNKYNSIIKNMYRVRIMGANALSFCLIAQGSLDGFLDLRKSNRLMDIAAGYLIVKEAGGNMFSKSGKDFDISLALDAEIPLVVSNSKLESFLKEELKKIKK
jgi:myo-inositol-1(or 4)-monophosphatase